MKLLLLSAIGAALLAGCAGGSTSSTPAVVATSPVPALTSAFAQTAPGGFALGVVQYAADSDPLRTASDVVVIYSPPAGARSCVQTLQVDAQAPLTPGATSVNGNAQLGSRIEIPQATSGATAATWVTCDGVKSAVYAARWQR